MKSTYADESSYQRPKPPPPSPSTLTKLPVEHLSDRSKYSVFLTYFQRRISEIGVHETLKETFFAGTPEAEQMKIRLFAGFVHSWIHIGYGLEFEQPAIVAEGCAMAACSEGWLMEFFNAMKEKIKENGKEGAKQDMEQEKTIVELLKEMRENEKLRTAAQWEDGNKIQGVLKRAPAEMVAAAAKYRVKPEKEVIERRMAENISVAGKPIHPLPTHDNTSS